MGRKRMVPALVALAGVLALAGCGSGGGISSASPAQITPAGALVYVEATIRPQGSQSSDAQRALTRLLGRNPIPTLQNTLQREARTSGLNYQRDFQSWLGRRVGIAVMGLSSNDEALIAPTNNTSAALTALDRAARNDHLTPASYRGVNYQVGTDSSGKTMALGIVGHNAVVGGATAFKAVIDASHGGSLSSNQTFQGALGSVASNAIMRGYVNTPQLVSALSNSPNLPATTRAQLAAALGQTRGAVTFGLLMAPKAITFEVHGYGTAKTKTGPGSDVSAMPGASWLALATGAISPQVQALLARERFGPSAAALNLFKQRYGIDLVNDVLPALGPLQLSIQGSSLGTLGAGLQVTPSNMAAAGRVLSAIYNRAAHSPSVSVQGKPNAFTVTKPGQPIPRFAISEIGRRVLATFDEAFSQLTSPSSKLSDNPAFQRAQSALGGDNRIPFFIDFTTLSQFTGQIGSFQSGGNDVKTQSFLQRADYFVIGDNPTAHDFRAVLGLR